MTSSFETARSLSSGAHSRDPLAHPQDEECVPRMLHSAISAFTRVFDTLLRCAADPRSIAPHFKCLDPGSAEQREERCTASGKRERRSGEPEGFSGRTL